MNVIFLNSLQNEHNFEISRSKVNTIGDNTEPCLTPFVALNDLDAASYPWTRIVLIVYLYVITETVPVRTLHDINVCQVVIIVYGDVHICSILMAMFS